MFEAIKKELEPHSMKLAAAYSAFVGWIIYNQDTLFALLSLVPIPDVPRGITAIAIALIFYFGPRTARYWPQPDIEEPSERGAS